MKILKTTLALLMLGAVSCAGHKISIQMASPAEALPQPSFKVKDLANESLAAAYARIRVYELAEGCRPPQCQLVWQAVVSSRKSPEKLTYAALPGFGSVNIIPPQPLERGKRYRMILDQLEVNPDQYEGSFDFEVAPDGSVRGLAE